MIVNNKLFWGHISIISLTISERQSVQFYFYNPLFRDRQVLAIIIIY
jgi:hypothetical protein